jgi:hypothetical protein
MSCQIVSLLIGSIALSSHFCYSEALHPCLPAGRHRAGLPGNVDMITGSAFLPAPAYRQEGAASSRLVRDGHLMEIDKKQSLFFRQRLTKKGEGDDGFQGIRGRTDRFDQKFR